MSLSPNEKYPGATEADPNYKDSKFKDNNPSTTNNGSPLKALDRNEQLALQEAMMNAAGFDYNGVVDTPQNSQMFNAYKAALSNGANLLSNHNFIIASPDDSQPAPSATPTSYPPGYEIFSGVFANETTGILNLTYIDGRVSFSGGDFYMAVPNTGALENITEFVASVADFDGKPRTRGVSYALVGNEYRVTVGVDALEDESANETLLGSVKFEQGNVATKHEAQRYKGNVYQFESVADAVSNCPTVGSLVYVEDYYGGTTPNNSGILFFRVVPAGTGTADGGKYIDVDAARQLMQNLLTPYSIKAWGAKGDGSDATSALFAVRDTGKDIYAPAGEYGLSDNLLLHEGQTLFGDGYQTHITTTQTGFAIMPGLKNKSGDYTYAYKNSIYYKREAIESTDWVVNNTTQNLYRGGTYIHLDDVSQYEAGDFVRISNGYCDMWRVMEDTSLEVDQFINANVELWRTAIHKVRSVNEVSGWIEIEEPLQFDVPLVPVTYGLVTDENDLPAYQGYNTPSVEKLVGAKNVTIRDLRITNNGTDRAIWCNGAENFNVRNVDIDGLSQDGQITLSLAVDSHLSGIRTQGDKYNVDIRDSSTRCSMTNINCSFGYSGDGPVLIWEQSYLCNASNIKLTTRNSIDDAAIGVYLNTCHDCTVTNVQANGYKSAVAIQFGGNGCSVSNVNAVTCRRVFSSYAARDYTVTNLTINGYIDASSAFTDYVLGLSSSYNFIISNVKQTRLKDLIGEQGRIHMFKCFNANLDNVIAPNATLDFSVADDINTDEDLRRCRVSNSDFYRGNVVSAAYNQDYDRTAEFYDCLFYEGVRLDKAQYVIFNGCRIFKTSGTTIWSDTATFARYIDCEIISNDAAFDFGTGGGRFRGSMILVKDCLIDAPTISINYENPDYILGGSTSAPTYARKGETVTVIDTWPEYRTWVNTAPTGGPASLWTQTFNSYGKTPYTN